jgi:hypothetical protein
VKGLFEIRAVAEAMLTRAGLVLTLAVLGTGALYHLAESARSLGNIGATFSSENVLGFGIYNTAVIGLAYFPAAPWARPAELHLGPPYGLASAER